MEYARLGSTGLTVSRICLGCLTFGSKQWREWMLEADAARPIIRHALDTGITHFDTADFYSLGVSETILGDALADFGVPRDKVVISSKVGLPVGADPNQRGLSRKHILHSIDSSLKRLRTDYIDLYQIHRFDPYTPVEETLEALDAIVRAGKALYIGASSMFTWQFAQLTSGASRRNKENPVYRFDILPRAENDPTYALRDALLAPQVQHRPAIIDEPVILHRPEQRYKLAVPLGTWRSVGLGQE